MAVNPASAREQPSPARILDFSDGVAAAVFDCSDASAICIRLFPNIQVGIDFVNSRIICFLLRLLRRIRRAGTDQLLEAFPISIIHDLARAVLAADIIVPIYSGCRDAGLLHDLFDDRGCVLEGLLIVISFLHAHFHADAATISIFSKQIRSSIVDSDVPASAVMRRGLVGSVAIINVIVGRHIGQLTIMLRFCVCAGIGARSEIICVVDYNTPRIVLFVGVLVADIRSVNSHDTSLSPADLRRRKKRTVVSRPHSVFCVCLII